MQEERRAWWERREKRRRGEHEVREGGSVGGREWGGREAGR